MSYPPDVVTARLDEESIPHESIVVGDDARLIVSSLGARVYGPFFGGGEAQNWIPAAFSSRSAFAELIDSGTWNVGGDRIWIGPEIAFMIGDRADYWGTYAMPAAMDAAAHQLTVADDRVRTTRSMSLRSFLGDAALGDAVLGDLPPGDDAVTALDLGILFAPAPNPLRWADDGGRLLEGVQFAGYRTETALSQRSASRVIAESWLLQQVQAGGTALVSGFPGVRVTDYYEPVGERLGAVAGGTAVSLTGAHRFKIGFDAPGVTGRLGYLRETGQGEAVLFIRSSPVTPGAEYAEEPDPSPGFRGDVLHLYNDDGGLGGFAEVEARGTPVAGTTATPAVDVFSSWWFRGPLERIEAIAYRLLGMRASRVPAPISVPGHAPTLDCAGTRDLEESTR